MVDWLVRCTSRLVGQLVGIKAEVGINRYIISAWAKCWLEVGTIVELTPYSMLWLRCTAVYETKGIREHMVDLV